MKETADKLFWEKYFQVYDVLNHVAPYQTMLNTVLESLDASRGDKILDAGAGTGNWSMIGKKNGLRVTSLDFSTAGLELYRKKDPNADIVEHDLTKKLPYPESSFDHVCVINTVYALPQHTHLYVFQEFFRVLRTGGRLSVVNLLEGYNPKRVYIEEIKENYKSHGILQTAIKITRLLIPTIKMFYYNRKLLKQEKGEKHFFTVDKQYELLAQCGFSHISEGRLVLANQAILHTATK